MLTSFKYNIIVSNKNFLPNYDYYICNNFIKKRNSLHAIEYRFIKKEPLNTFLQNKKKIRTAEKNAFIYLFLKLLFNHGSFCKKKPKYFVKFVNSKTKPIFTKNLNIKLPARNSKVDVLFFMEQNFNSFMKIPLFTFIQKII